MRIGSVHTLFKIPRKFSVYFSTNHFFPQIKFSGADVWCREYINRASGSHTSSWISSHCRERHPTTPSDQIKATARRRPDNRPSAGLDIPFACLFKKKNEIKLNLLVSLIFLATTRLYITQSFNWKINRW